MALRDSFQDLKKSERPCRRHQRLWEDRSPGEVRSKRTWPGIREAPHRRGGRSGMPSQTRETAAS